MSHGHVMRTWASLTKREVVRSLSPWVSGKRETKWSHLLRVPATCLLFGAMACVLGKATLRDYPLGLHQTYTLTSLLVVLTVVGFGAVGLSAALIADDWSTIGREHLWGTGAAIQVAARFAGMLIPAIALGAGVGVVYCHWAGAKGDRLVAPMTMFSAALLALYAVACLALGLAISAFVGGVRVTVYVLMGLMSLLVLLSDLPFALEDLGGFFGRAFTYLSYAFPSRYGAGAWASGLSFSPEGLGGNRGWTWSSTWTTIIGDSASLVGLIGVYLTLAILRVRRKAPHHID